MEISLKDEINRFEYLSRIETFQSLSIAFTLTYDEKSMPTAFSNSLAISNLVFQQAGL